jgi:hypothetical protein
MMLGIGAVIVLRRQGFGFWILPDTQLQARD